MLTHYTAGRRFARLQPSILARKREEQAWFRAQLVASFGEAHVADMERLNQI
jgi:hypothetical protein